MDPLCPPPVPGGVDLDSLLKPPSGPRAFFVDSGRKLLVVRPFQHDSWSHWFWGLLEGIWSSREELIQKGRLPVTNAAYVLKCLHESVKNHRAQLQPSPRKLGEMDPVTLALQAQALVEDDCGSYFKNDAAEQQFRIESAAAARRAGLLDSDDEYVATQAKGVPQRGRAIGELTPQEIREAVSAGTARWVRHRNEPAITQALNAVPFRGAPAQQDDLRARLLRRILDQPECLARLLTNESAEAVTRRFIACEQRIAMLRLGVNANTAEWAYQRAVEGKAPLVLYTTYTKGWAVRTVQMCLALQRLESDERLNDGQKAALTQLITQVDLPPESIDKYVMAVLKVQELQSASLALAAQPREARQEPKDLLNQAIAACKAVTATLAPQSAKGQRLVDEQRVKELSAIALLGLRELQARSLPHFPAHFNAEVVKRESLVTAMQRRVAGLA